MTHPLKALGNQQRAALERDVRQVERAIVAAYRPAQAQARIIAERFAAAYRHEYERVNADREEDDPPVNVSLAWLRTSGWGERLVRAFQDAAGQAAEESRQVVTAAIRAAATQGQDDARALLVRAMRPAVRAGLAWTPNEPRPAHHQKRRGQ